MSILLWDPKDEACKMMNMKKYPLEHFYLASFYVIWNLVQIQINNYHLNRHNANPNLVNGNDSTLFPFTHFLQKK